MCFVSWRGNRVEWLDFSDSMNTDQRGAATIAAKNDAYSTRYIARILQWKAKASSA